MPCCCVLLTQNEKLINNKIHRPKKRRLFQWFGFGFHKLEAEIEKPVLCVNELNECLRAYSPRV